MVNFISYVPSFNRRAVIASGLAVVMLGSAWAAPPPLVAEVWKDGGCPCCKDWVKYMEDHGFKVKVNDTSNSAIAAVRAKLGVDPKYAACHTAQVGGYAIEGHVPVREILRLLQERPPNAIGLATLPGMPLGSPGMDAPTYQGIKDSYSVMLLLKSGDTREYQRYLGKKS